VDNTALICGGGNSGGSGWQKSCYSLKEDGAWKLEASSELNTARGYAATGSVIMNNKLVLAGGYNENYLTTIEVAAPNTKSETLPISLPVGMYGSCIVPWDTNTFVIMGGYSGSNRKQTHFVNMANNTVTNGPSLLKARSTFSCHSMSINGEEYIIAAGGWPGLKSTEYLPKANYGSGWQKSVDSPVNLRYHEMVASEGNLYTIGIRDYFKDIYKFSCTNSITNCSWTKIPTQLQYGREFTVALPIPSALANKLCN